VHLAWITAHPVGEWVTQQAPKLLMNLEGDADGLDAVFAAAGVRIIKALVRVLRAKDLVRRKIERYGRTIEPRRFSTIGAAVAAFRDQTGARWAAAERTVPGQTAAD
jgi:hypothetical protein